MIDAATEALRATLGQTVEVPLGLLAVIYSYSPDRIKRLAETTGVLSRIRPKNDADP